MHLRDRSRGIGSRCCRREGEGGLDRVRSGTLVGGALDGLVRKPGYDYGRVNLPIVELRVWQTLLGLHSHVQNARCRFGGHDDVWGESYLVSFN